ncbi:MAG TPA: hypothetical protein VGC80_14775 [Acetobacteraceae bacterium]
MIDLPSPVRILAALELRPHTWIRTGPWSIAHADLRVRLTLATNAVHIKRIARGVDPVTIKAAPTTRARIGVLLEEWLRKDQERRLGSRLC